MKNTTWYVPCLTMERIFLNLFSQRRLALTRISSILLNGMNCKWKFWLFIFSVCPLFSMYASYFSFLSQFPLKSTKFLYLKISPRGYTIEETNFHLKIWNTVLKNVHIVKLQNMPLIVLRHLSSETINLHIIVHTYHRNTVFITLLSLVFIL